MTDEAYYRYLVESDPVVLPVSRWRTALAALIEHPCVFVVAVFLWGLGIGFVAVATVVGQQ